MGARARVHQWMTWEPVDTGLVAASTEHQVEQTIPVASECQHTDGLSLARLSPCTTVYTRLLGLLVATEPRLPCCCCCLLW